MKRNNLSAVLAKTPSEVIVTEREVWYVQQLSNGYSREEMASDSGLSIRTVEANLDALRKKSNCRSIPQMVATFLRNGLIK